MYQNILDTLHKYGEVFPEDSDLPKFLEYLHNPENRGQNCVDRKNFNGHITTSALVIKKVGGKEKVLVLWHKTFQKYMQPGGHIDPPDKTCFEASVREVKEEAGLDVEIGDGVFGEIPISIDAHPIAKNEKKIEEAHIHFDLCFLLRLKNENQEIKNEDEGVDDAQWIDISEINENSNNVLYKGIRKYLEFKD